MRQIETILLAGIAAMFMSACGGGSSDPVDPVEPNTNKYDLRTWIDTGSYLINGEGTLTSPEGTINVTGSFQSTYLGTSIFFSGETVHDHNVTMILGEEGGTPFTRSLSRSTYMGNVVSVTNAAGGGACDTTLELAALIPVPTNAEVGYMSEVVPYLCDDGTYITNQIKLEDAGSGNAIFSLLINVYEAEGEALIVNETDSIVITPDMSLLSGEIIGSFPLTGISYELYSTSIVQD